MINLWFGAGYTVKNKTKISSLEKNFDKYAFSSLFPVLY